MKKKATAHKITLTNIKKRDGSAVPFDPGKIMRAVGKAMYAANEFHVGAPDKITESVLKKLF